MISSVPMSITPKDRAWGLSDVTRNNRSITNNLDVPHYKNAIGKFWEKKIH